MLRLVFGQCELFPIASSDAAVWKERQQNLIAIHADFSIPNITRAVKVQKDIRVGMEQAMNDCPGPVTCRQRIQNILAEWKSLGLGSPIISDVGDLRFVDAVEASCQNPFLKTQEYADLRAQITPDAMLEYEAKLVKGITS